MEFEHTEPEQATAMCDSDLTAQLLTGKKKHKGNKMQGPSDKLAAKQPVVVPPRVVPPRFSQERNTRASQKQGTKDGHPVHRKEGRLQHLKMDLRQRLAESVPTEEDKRRVERCITFLEAAAANLGSQWKVALFGSVVNGFGTSGSDLDATIFREGEVPVEEQEGQGAACILGENIAPLLQNQAEFAVAEQVFGARVPILKLHFEDRLEVDLSCNNTMPLHNTSLLYAYSSLDNRVRDLGIAVKLWAKAAHVCGAAMSHLSSYTFTLMVIYFMQVAPKVRLPRLPIQAFEEGGLGLSDERVKNASGWASHCSLSLEQLVARFFNFYAQEFVWGHEVVSLRFGSRLPPSESVFRQLKGRQNECLHVEDPCNNTRNLNCVLGDFEEMQLRHALGEACLAIQHGETPVGLQSSFSLAAQPIEIAKSLFYESEQARTVPLSHDTNATQNSLYPESDDLRSRASSESTASTASTASSPGYAESSVTSGSEWIGAGSCATTSMEAESCPSQTTVPNGSCSETSACGSEDTGVPLPHAFLPHDLLEEETDELPFTEASFLGDALPGEHFRNRIDVPQYGQSWLGEDTGTPARRSHSKNLLHVGEEMEPAMLHMGNDAFDSADFEHNGGKTILECGDLESMMVPSGANVIECCDLEGSNFHGGEIESTVAGNGRQAFEHNNLEVGNAYQGMMPVGKKVFECSDLEAGNVGGGIKILQCCEIESAMASQAQDNGSGWLRRLGLAQALHQDVSSAEEVPFANADWTSGIGEVPRPRDRSGRKRRGIRMGRMGPRVQE